MNESPVKVRNAFNLACSGISHIYSREEASSIVELAFRRILNCSRIELYQKFDTNLSNSQQTRLNEIITELRNYRPIQYILGETEFYGLLFKVGPGILIPRSETEELVDWIVKDNNQNNSLRILDIGTGSGCIAVALAKNLPVPIIEAMDISESALKYASQNAASNNCLITILKQDILSGQNKTDPCYDLIVSNPPYIPESDKISILPNVLEYEPHLALFVPDSDPLLFYIKIMDFALLAGKPGCKLYFEIHEKYGKEIQELFEKKGFEDILIRHDIHGKDRMARGRIPLIKVPPQEKTIK